MQCYNKYMFVSHSSNRVSTVGVSVCLWSCWNILHSNGESIVLCAIWVQVNIYFPIGNMLTFFNADHTEF